MINTIKNYIKNRSRFVDVRNINQVKTYKPNTNKLKARLMFSLVVVCFITPMTNWILPIVVKLISKFNPLWIYK